MLKIRLQGTKEDIKWFMKLMKRDKRYEVGSVSDIYDNSGTRRYKRAYADIYRKGDIKIRFID